MRPRTKALADSVIAFPLGLLVVSPVFDILLIATDDPLWGQVGFWTLTIGMLGGFSGLAAEVWKLRHEHPATRTYRITLFEIGAFLAALLFYVTSWVIQVAVGLRAGLASIGGGELACSLLGSVILLLAGWLGGPIVDRFRTDPMAEAAARED